MNGTTRLILVKTSATLFLCALLLAVMSSAASVLAGPADFALSERELEDAIRWLNTHHLSETDFLRASTEPDTVIFDASEAGTYAQLHVAGAVHLPAATMNAETLALVLPDKNARILIYQNNNYAARERRLGPRLPTNELGIPFAGVWSGVNGSTCALLRRYGYRNVYELATYVEIGRGNLPVVSGASAAHLDQPVTLSLSTGRN